MAEMPLVKLKFFPKSGADSDCGKREVSLPAPVPELGDDFAWASRDFERFRIAMLEELAARFPERTRWTPADVEVVLVEVMAWALDQLSDMLDRVTAEAYLETARRPESVRLLLGLIGYDAVAQAGDKANISDARSPEELCRYWERFPMAMEAARIAGPRDVHSQRRMVSLDDYASRMVDHPLVRRAKATVEWNGSWHLIRVAVILWENHWLEDVIPVELPSKLQERLEAFHRANGLSGGKSFQDELMAWLGSLRMAGQEVRLENPVWVGIDLSLSARIAANYYQSEVRHDLSRAFSNKAGGFFAIGKLRFGQDLNLGDVMQTAMQVEGVESVFILAFNRVGGSLNTDGNIRLDGLEVAVCDNDPAHPERGTLSIQCQGGLKG